MDNPALTFILVDARMAKRNIDTRLDQADLVIGLGPGLTRITSYNVCYTKLLRM